MRITGGRVYALRIPFVEAFAHSTSNRAASDSFVVELVADDGTAGRGEGLAREYVTGETCAASIEHIRNVLFPLVAERDFPALEIGDDPLAALAPVDGALPVHGDGAVVFHAARAAVETALVDCLLRRRNLSLGALLPPARETVTYSGAITSGATEKAVKHALGFKLFGIKQLKIKIGDRDGVARVAAVRAAVGDDFSLRVDANGAYSPDEAAEVAARLAPYRVDSFEQPFPKETPLAAAAAVRAASPVPLMADESLVTFEDAARIAAAHAFDLFNLRVSKCGGIAPTLRLADLARRHGIGVQLGCQVGETAILSAVGRHLAAHLADARFVEGSYGRLLLAEDIARQPINFGHGGRAPLLRGAGFGVEIVPAMLEKYAASVTPLGRERKTNA